MHAAAFLSLCAIVTIARADVSFIAPAPGGSLPAGAVTISWKDSGTAPLISELLSYTLNLYSGSNAAPKDLGAIKPAGTAFSGTSTTVTIDPSLGDSTANAYFIGMTSVAKAGGQVINYSGRFTLSGMTGTFDAATLEAIAAVAGSAGPPTQNQVAAAAVTPAAGGAAAAGNGKFAVPYTLQTGPIRYAPMQPLPGTKITAANTSPLWPASSVPIAKTFLPVGSVTVTYTEPQTASFMTHTNTAAAASGPEADMQKFLNRWKD